MKQYRFLILLIVTVLSACSHAPTENKLVATDPDTDGIERLVKSDIDEVIEIHQRTVIRDLKKLMLKLYRRNPAMRQDKNSRSIEQSVALVFSMPMDAVYPDWRHKKGSDIIRLAFDDAYKGDRVFALIVGLRKMLMASYDNHTEFYFLTSIDEQKLYNSARNIEIAAWLLSDKRDKNGKLLILSDSMHGKQLNLSFQRLIGRMIATQDNLAEVIAHKEGRIIKSVVIRTATLAFLPI